MNFSIIPEAEASVQTLMKSINKVIINPIIILLFALAVVYFIYGLAQYFLNPDSEEIRKASKSKMIYGIIGLFIMTAVFGIETIILNSMGVNNIKITSTGDYEIVDSKSESKLIDTGTGLTDTPYVPVDTGNVNLTDNPNLPEPAKGLTYTSDPFSTAVPNAKLCWRKTVYATGKSFYESSENVKTKSRSTYLAFLGIDPVTMPTMAKEIGLGLPILYGEVKYYDKVGKLYYAWQDIRAPIASGKESDCSAVVSEPTSQSNKASSLIGAYQSDGFAYRVVDSGVNLNLSKARSIAINNALIQIAKLKGLYNTSDISYTILAEKHFEPDQTTGEYHYFVAISSAR